MRRLYTHGIFILLVLTSFLTFTSCEEKGVRKYLTDSVYYLEAPAEYNLGNIHRRNSEFKPMTKDEREDFYKVIQNQNNYIWLKIDFTIPTNLRFKDLGFYVPQLHSACKVYINDRFVKQYGHFPPEEQSAGFQSQYFLFPKENLNSSEKNTILIQCWPGAFAGIYGELFISDQNTVQTISDTVSFHNSRIILCFVGILLIIFFLYIFLYYVMKRFETNKEYLYYALTMLYTVHFLVPFFLPEIAWIRTNHFSYLTILKIFGGGGAAITIYFANSFILTYINYKATLKNTLPRLILLLVTLIEIVIIPSYGYFKNYILICAGLSALQFSVTIPALIKAFYSTENRRHAGLLLLGFTPVIITVIIDFIIHIVIKNRASPFFTIYGWQFTIIIFLIFLLVRFTKVYIHNGDLKNQLENVNTHLEDLVGIRTKELSEVNYSLSQGLETVSHVQSNFLPAQEKSFRGWDLAVYYKALDNEVSGDLYDYYYTNEKLDGVGIFDVSGHGISAGLMTILAKGIIGQEFISGITHDDSVSDILLNINKTYIKEKVNVENYITGLLFHFEDFNENDVCSVELANAGHPYPLLYNSENDNITEVKHSDSRQQFGFLGIDGLEVSFPSLFFTMKQNDVIVCFTDGLTESMNSSREEFSKERLIEIIKKYHDYSAEQIKEQIIYSLGQFLQDSKSEDDVTFIVLKRTPSADYIEEI